MIDIKRLRDLAQAATPGPWKLGQYLGSPRQFVIHMDVGDKGRGSDVAFTSASFGNDETIANARLIAAANPAAISELLDRLEGAEKERDALRSLVVMRFDHDHPPQFTQGYDTHDLLEPVTAEHCQWFVAEIERLRAKIRRDGAAGAGCNGYQGRRLSLLDERATAEYPLYALPGAQGETK